MTVAELIEILQRFPHDAVVLTPGFDESGLENPKVDLQQIWEFRGAAERYRDDSESRRMWDGSNNTITREPPGIEIQAVIIDFGGDE